MLRRFSNLYEDCQRYMKLYPSLFEPAETASWSQKVLYHYTTAGGLLGILKPDANALWASGVGFSNDSSEGRYANEIGLDAIRNYLKNNPLPPFRDDLDWRILLREYDSWFEQLAEDRESAYLVSFCEEDNLLSQWRAYGGIASFSIGFSNLQDDVDRVLTKGSFRFDLAKIEYDLARQKQALIDIIEYAKENFQERPHQDYFDRHQALDRDGQKDAALEDYLEDVKTWLKRDTAIWAHSVKHEAFREEKEWRIIALPIFNSSSSSQGYAELREYKGRLLPYIRVIPKNNRFTIASITVGPSKTQSLEVEAVRMLLDKSRLRSVEIKASDTPLQW